MVLQAVMTPERENTLRSALATSMMGLNAQDLEALNNDENAWDAVVEEFDGYRQIWHKRGVMPMLRALMTTRQIAENLLATAGGERRLTDILHISELLQEAGSQLESEHALVRWLSQHILEPDSNASASSSGWKATSIWSKSSLSINLKGWSIRWSGCVYHEFPRPGSGFLPRSQLF